MTSINNNKKAYLDYKEKLLADIKYYEKSIEEFRANDKNNKFYDHNSSDSEDDWLCNKNVLPKPVELKRQQSRLRTYLQATQELTGLTVLQFEVNVLVEDPVINGEPMVLEAGTWREVAAECRLDLVPFTITFYAHTPDRRFGQPRYRGVRAVPVKPPHEAELANSALHSLATPSDAVEVIRSYAAAYRSRRTTLARLANKYTNALTMEPHSDGGFVLKCANLLEMVWRLENKWSPVAPFHHKMKFDLEFMEESYIKIISQCHKRLSDPSIQTEERTLLLSKIISTCLEASGLDPHETTESDLESKTTECDLKRDSEVMAPPKSLPKKAKTKIDSNTAEKRSNDGSKRMIDNDNNGNDENARNVPNVAQKSNSNDGSKIMKSNDNDNAKSVPDNAQKRSISDGSKRMKGNDNVRNMENNENAKNVPNTAQKRNNNDKGNDGSKRMKSNDNNKNDKVSGNTAIPKISQNKSNNIENTNKDSNTKNKIDKSKKSIATAKNSANTVAKTTEPIENKVANVKNVNTNKNKAITTQINSNTKEAKKSNNIIGNTKNKADNGKTKDKNEAPAKKSKNSAEEKNPAEINSNNEEANDKNKLTKDKNAANTKTVSNSKDKNNINNVANKKITSHSTNTQKSAQHSDDKLNANAKNKIGKQNSVAKTKNVAKNDNVKVANSKDLVNNKEHNENVPKNVAKNTVTEKNLANTKTKDKIADMSRIPAKMIKDTRKPTTRTEKIISGNLQTNFSKPMLMRPANIRSNNIFKTGDTEKENGGRMSKIPQKKLTPISEKSLKSNPLRISPRTFSSKFKTLSNKNIAKITNIPMFKKSVTKQ